MNKLVHNVIWPAVAGNVLWGFLQVFADPQVVGYTLCQRLFSLLFVGVYLAVDWINTDKVTSINDDYWRYDIPLAATIVTFAISTQAGAPWAPIPLGFAFAVAVVGHCSGAWDESTKQSSCYARAALATINALGILVLLGGWFFGGAIMLWSMPVAIFLVVSLFLSLRKKIATL